MKYFFLLTVLAITATAQPVSVGVEAGVPLTDAFQTAQGNQSSYFTNTKRYTIGPTVSIHLPLRFSVEVDALYRRLGYQFQQVTPTVVFASTVANSWEFPVLLKYEIFSGPIRPFVDVGASFRHIAGVHQIRTAINAVGSVTNTSLDNAPEFNSRNDAGFDAGAGVEFKIGRLRISPEVRYTRWGTEAFRDPVRSLLNSDENQADFLLGLTF